MDDFQRLLARDFGVRPQGKAAPMSASRATGSSWPNPRSNPNPTPTAPSYEDLFGAAPTPSARSYDDLFDSFQGSNTKTKPKPKPNPKPVYDDDIFDRVPGLNASSSVGRYDGDDVLPANHGPPAYDDLLRGFGRRPPAEVRKTEWERKPVVEEEGVAGFDDLIPGFGGSSLPRRR